MKKTTILFTLLIIVSQTIKAQKFHNYKDLDKNEKFISIVQFSYMKNYKANNEITLSGQGKRNNKLNTDNAHAYSLQVVLGYFVVPKRLSIGMGFGLDGYHEPGFNSAPLYGDIRLYLTDERNAVYMYANLGTLTKLSSRFVRGYSGKIGCGYKFFVSQKLCLNADIGYAAKGASLTNESYTSSDNIINIKGVALSIGATLF